MTIIQSRRGTAAQWSSANPVLMAGEIGYETDTQKHKIGNGSTAWTGLTYFVNETNVKSLINAETYAMKSRTLEPLSQYGYTGGEIRLHRTGNTVYLTAIGVTRNLPGSGYQNVANLPVGFRPVSPFYFRTLVGTAFGYVTTALMISGASVNENFSVSYLTSDSWSSA